jgi:capsular exopolysaccharide synthesis family protein
LTTQTEPTTGGDLGSFIGIVRRRKLGILLITALTVGSALFFSLRTEPLYRSSARVLVKPLNPNQALGGFNYSFLISMGTEAALAQSPAVGDRAAAIIEAEGGDPVDTGTVQVSNPTDTTFLDITYTDGIPDRAAVWADAYARGYMENRAEQALSAYDAAASGYDQRIAQIQSDLSQKRAELIVFRRTTDLTPAEAIEARRLLKRELQTLQQQLTVVQAQRAQLPIPSEDTAEIIDPADVPTSPASPNHVQNVLLGLLAGLALGVGLAFTRERLDDRLAGRADLEAQIGAPALAIVPTVHGWHKKKTTKLIAVEEPKSPAAEAYRTIRANLQFMAREGGLQIVELTSPSLGEGKTTTTADLAVTLANAGKRVIAVSCDLRKPRLHEFFGLGNEPGLSELLRGEAELLDVTQRTSVDTLRVISSGGVPHNPSELLASDAMARFLDSLRRYADFVLLDTPPVLAVSDALILAPKSDGVIIIVDAGHTSRSAVAHTREQLEQVGATILGGVLNNLDPSRAKSYPSYVRDYYGYGYASPDGKAVPSGNGARSERNATPEELWR